LLIQHLGKVGSAKWAIHAFLDTADYYLAGHNELLIAGAIKGKREKAFLSVKTGHMVVPGPIKL